MKDEHVSIWVLEKTHQADACVNDIAEQLRTTPGSWTASAAWWRRPQRDGRIRRTGP